MRLDEDAKGGPARVPSLSDYPMVRAFTSDQHTIDGAWILITGGTGSFGQKLVETLLTRHNPAKVIILSRDELKQFEMQGQLLAKLPRDKTDKLRFFLGDVRDRERLTTAFRNVDLVVHAAALKQVPAAEYNPSEFIKTNIGGAENVVHAALANRVKQVIALSTDKACNPINLYGATKLASDKVFVAANNIAGGIGTQFSVVRYGNVVGSRGSVVPFFRNLIKAGTDHIPITDDRMTRFWITLQQGVDFVISCSGIMRGGELFVPKIPSMKITDLANLLAPQLEQRVVGIRPGEKLHELMISADDAPATVEMHDRYVIEPMAPQFDRVSYVGERDIHKAPADFQYGSNTNTEWLDEDGMRALLTAAGQLN